MPDLVFKASLLFWILTLEKDLQTTWIIPGLPTLCFRNYWLAAIPTVPFLELLRTSTSEPCPPSHTITITTITNRTSGLRQSKFKYLPAPFISVCSSVVVSPPPGGSTSTSYCPLVPAPPLSPCSL
ncbi:hypothetical protein CRENBAI_017028 [Crenichthys baileyi]|uniref:Uncharacterized protein n=1 Tax=Crenichthys baileyi TaxID=28760 RepID=A0AAV9SPN5_9TELE